MRTVNLTIALLFCVARAATAQVTYSIVDLGSLAGGYDTSALAVNNAGHVVGSAMDGSGRYVAFLYVNSLQALGTLGGIRSKANGINSSDQIVGNSLTATGVTHAFLYDAGAGNPTMTDLHATLGFGGTFSSATAINTAGQIVGAADIANGSLHAFLLTGSTAVDLHSSVSFGGPNSFAYAISDTGWIGGVSDDSSGHSRAFLYNVTTSTLTDLGTLGGPDSVAMAVDASGSAVGNSRVDATDTAFAFQTQPGLPIVPANSLNALGGAYSFAFGINGLGQIVGEADDVAGFAHAFVYTPASGMQDLESLVTGGSGWMFSAATAINESGQIVGNGIRNGGNSAFLLSPQLPNLYFSALGASTTMIAPGSSITVSATVGNDGSTAAGSFRVGLYLSSDATCTPGDTFLTSQVVPTLAPGGSSVATLSATIPGGTPLGASFICAIADDLLQVWESTETDNTISDPVTVVAAVPVVTLKVNGQHPNPPVVTTAGPMNLTLDIAPSAYTASLSWYWALIVNGQLLWVTSTGLSATPAPLAVAPPLALTNVTLLNTTLAKGLSVTSLFFMVDGSAALVAADFITTTRP